MATASSVLDQKLSRSPGKIGMLGLRRRPCHRRRSTPAPACFTIFPTYTTSPFCPSSFWARAAGRPRLRVRQRLPRHRQRRRHRHLHPLPRAAHRRRLVRLLEFPRRARFQRPRRLRHRLATARRTDPASRQQSRLRHGLRPARRRHHLEPRHLVVRPARLQFAHPHRLRHRRRHRQPAHERPQPAPAASTGDRPPTSARLCCSPRSSASVAPRFCCSSPKPSSKIPNSTPLPKAPSRRRSTSAACSSSPAPASASSTAPTTDKKAWASSCSSSSAPSPPPTPSTTPSPTRIRRISSPSPSRPPTSSTNYVSPNAAVGDAHDDVTDYIRDQEFHPQHHARPRAPWSATSATKPRSTKR